MKRIVLLIMIISAIGTMSAFSQDRWREGILVDEFIYEKASFPSCHAATIAETTDGTLVIAWFGGTREGNPDVCIYLSRYENAAWTIPMNVADGIQEDGSRQSTWNPVLYQVPDGELQLYYKIGKSPGSWHGWMKVSNDDGKTWSQARALPEGYIGPVKNKPVLVGDKLICSSSTEGQNGWRVHFEISEDFGKTWSRTEPINDGKDIVAIQPSILTYRDGRLQVLCRSKNRAVLESWSDDGGKTWSPMQKTTLPNNNSGTDAVTLSNGSQLLVYNHVLPPGDEAKGPRTPLNISLSNDGREWMAALVVEDIDLEKYPGSQFSYPSVIQTKDGLVHVVYTWSRKKIKHVVVDPRKLKLTKIENGQWPVDESAADTKNKKAPKEKKTKEKKQRNAPRDYSFTGEELTATGGQDIFLALSGKIPGSMLIYDDFGSPSLLIYRSSSANTTDKPLYVIDGFVVDDISHIILKKIEKVEVLRDASAWGANKGSNGAIVVTTRK